MGGLALHNRQTLDQLCQPKSRCPASAQGSIDAMNDFATGSTIGFGLLLVGAGVGTAVLLTGDGGAKPARSPSPTAAPSPSPSLTAAPWIGPGSAGIRGAF
jgi:hypothetical protein